jgi:hypothetical protein
VHLAFCRDLKLENIMLCPWGTGTTAKLVDFGLHKVIDDRIKKVVKRVASEAYLGSRLGLRRVAANATEGEEEEEEGPAEDEDELEVALAQQRAEKAKKESSNGSQNGSMSSSPEKRAEKSSPSGVSFSRDAAGDRGAREDPLSPRSRVAGRGAVLRAQSRLHLMAPAMEAHKEEDEEELALQEAAEAKQQSSSPDASAVVRSGSSRGEELQAEASQRHSQVILTGPTA